MIIYNVSDNLYMIMYYSVYKYDKYHELLEPFQFSQSYLTEPLLDACRNNNITMIKSILERMKNQYNNPDIIHVCVKLTGSLEIMQECYNFLKTRDYDLKYDLLSAALRSQHYHIVDWIIDNKIGLRDEGVSTDYISLYLMSYARKPTIHGIKYLVDTKKLTVQKRHLDTAFGINYLVLRHFFHEPYKQTKETTFTYSNDIHTLLETYPDCDRSKYSKYGCELYGCDSIESNSKYTDYNVISFNDYADMYDVWRSTILSDLYILFDLPEDLCNTIIKI
jgi:hypothetical protein